jgi:predicted enzyme related to lactoylglutathione lyase
VHDARLVGQQRELRQASGLMAAKLGLVLDCADPDKLAEFWSAAIGYTTLGGAGSYVLLADADGRQPKLLLQRVPEAKPGKNRMHLDIETATVDDEVARLEELGAKRLEGEARAEHGTHWVIMADPEGNEFCVCDGGQSG